ncbi:MAG: hypothetical protein KBA40_03100 [Candidatus Peribacteraceae bacterium]|nr:hypothetical protein [Candidatus Peribacteraceae bacterium]MBP9850395.1 hypothetical protein [Candidatus Peribacteraceae bacterium]
MSLRMRKLRLSRMIKSGALLSTFAFVPKAMAQVYGGCGILCGISSASGLTGLTTATSISELVFKIINFILDIALLLAVLAIIIAGLYLITSQGEEGQKDKAKKIIFYAIIGVLLILFSRAIVMLINSIFF